MDNANTSSTCPALKTVEEVVLHRAKCLMHVLSLWTNSVVVSCSVMWHKTPVADHKCSNGIMYAASFFVVVFIECMYVGALPGAAKRVHRWSVASKKFTYAAFTHQVSKQADLKECKWPNCTVKQKGIPLSADRHNQFCTVYKQFLWLGSPA